MNWEKTVRDYAQKFWVKTKAGVCVLEADNKQ